MIDCKNESTLKLFKKDYDDFILLLVLSFLIVLYLPLYKAQHGELQGYIKAIETMQLVSLKQYRCGAVRLFQPTQFKLEREIELLKGAK